ncbi:hypothetical protein FFLO_04559 [Filobasidium floriforme]|uniref:DUF1996 domain-containing protein n=1 Tax=Filobasidium floriforme TaxID=5210 RepID=A0A8K0JK60_9TREE|nr:hypothetical protein FFLO_04559 [Filobasidium floriforme]
MARTALSSRALAATVWLLATCEIAQASVHFISGHPKLLDTRLDPIRTEGKPASHVHRIAGSSALMETVTYEELRASECTTAEVEDDKSLYWQPTLYYQSAAGTFQRLDPDGGLVVYWKADKAGDDEPLFDMPNGLRIIAGDPKRNTPHDNAVFEDRATGFKCFCQGGPQCHDAGAPVISYNFEDVKKYNCDIIRLETDFPNCWDGVNTDSPDHKSHMAYSEGPCPASHPKRIPTTRIEAWYGVANIPWTTEGMLTLSNGDQTGYSIHGDFINGFDGGDVNAPHDAPLTRALMECNMQGAASSCPILAPYIKPKTQKCLAARKLEEDIGETAPLTKLPGNNPVWSAPMEKPSDPNYVEKGQIINNPGGSLPLPGASAPVVPQPSAQPPLAGTSTAGAPAATDAAPVIPTAAIPTGTVQPVVGVPADAPPASSSNPAVTNPAPVGPTAAVPVASQVPAGLPSTTVAAAVGVPPSETTQPPVTDVAPVPATDSAAQPQRTWSRGGGGKWGGGGRYGNKTTPVLQNAAAIQTAPAGGCQVSKKRRREMKRLARADLQL